MANQATLVYSATPQLQPLANLVTQMGAVPLQYADFPAAIGATVTSDSTAAFGGNAVRTIVFNLRPVFSAAAFALVNPFAALHLPSPFRGSIVSSNPADTQKLRTIYCPEDDPASFKSGSEDAVLAGTTPVQLIEGDKVRILSMQVLNGVAAPTGLVVLYSDLDAGLKGNGNAVAEFAAANFTGSIFSTSSSDVGGATPGVGARTIAVTYHDMTGAGPFVEIVTLNGQTPVNFVNPNKYIINNIVIASAGASLGNLGTITIATGPNGTGGLRALIPPSFYANYPPGTDQVAPFQGLFTYALSNALSTKIVESLPVIS